MRNETLIGYQTQTKSKMVAVFTLLVFMVTSMINPGLVRASIIPTMTQSPEITIPPHIGTIQKTFTAKKQSGPTIIHIQDAHANYEAQKNIHQILDALNAQIESDRVYVEGSDEPVNTSLLRAFPFIEKRNAIVDESVRAGKITGAEEYAITADRDVELVGIDNNALYLENVKTYIDAQRISTKLAPFLSVLRSKLVALRDSLCNGALLTLIENREQFLNQQMDPIEYTRYLISETNRLSIDTKKYKHFTELSELEIYQIRINTDNIGQETQALIENDLIPALSEEDSTRLALAELDFRGGRMKPYAFYYELRDLALKEGIDFREFKNINLYLNYLSLVEGIDAEKLMREREKIEEKLLNTLCRTKVEKEVCHLFDVLKVLENITSLKAIPEDLQFFEKHEKEFTTAHFLSFIEAEKDHRLQVSDLNSSAIEIAPYLPLFKKFYRLAESREATFVKQTLRNMKENKEAVGILMTGGYHTRGIEKRLEEKGISYLVVTPRLTELPQENLYEKIMASYDKYFGVREGSRGGTVALLSPLVTKDKQQFKDYLNDIVPELTQYIKEQAQILAADPSKIDTVADGLQGKRAELIYTMIEKYGLAGTVGKQKARDAYFRILTLAWNYAAKGFALAQQADTRELAIFRTDDLEKTIAEKSNEDWTILTLDQVLAELDLMQDVARRAERYKEVTQEMPSVSEGAKEVGEGQKAITKLIQARDEDYLDAVGATGTADIIDYDNKKYEFAPGKIVFDALKAHNRATIAVNIVSYSQIEGHIRAAMNKNAALILEVAKSQLGYALDEKTVMRYVRAITARLGATIPIVVHGDHIQYSAINQLNYLSIVYDEINGEGAFTKQFGKVKSYKDVQGKLKQEVLDRYKEGIQEHIAKQRSNVASINERLIKAGFTSIAIDASTLFDEIGGDAVLDYYEEKGSGAEKLVVQLEKNFDLPLEWGTAFLKADPEKDKDIIYQPVFDDVVKAMKDRDVPQEEINNKIKEMEAAFGILTKKATQEGLNAADVIAAYDQISAEVANATVVGIVSDKVKAYMGEDTAQLLLTSSNAEETAKQLIHINTLLKKYRSDLVGIFGLEVEVGHVDKKVPNPRRGGAMEAKMTHPAAVEAMASYLHQQGLSFQLIATNNGSGHGTTFNVETLTPESQIGKISPFLTEELQAVARKYGASIAQHGTSGSDMAELAELARKGVIKFNIATNYQQIIINVLSLIDDGLQGEALMQAVEKDKAALMSGLHEKTREKMNNLADQFRSGAISADFTDQDSLFLTWMKRTYAWGQGKEKIKDLSSYEAEAAKLAKELRTVTSKDDFDKQFTASKFYTILEYYAKKSNYSNVQVDISELSEKLYRAAIAEVFAKENKRVFGDSDEDLLALAGIERVADKGGEVPWLDTTFDAYTKEQEIVKAKETQQPLKDDTKPPVYYYGKFNDDIDKYLPKGGKADKMLLGGKGANLAEMANELSGPFKEWLKVAKNRKKYEERAKEIGLDPSVVLDKLGLNVPPGFTITVEQTKKWESIVKAKGITTGDLTLVKGNNPDLAEMKQAYIEALHRLEQVRGQKLGDTDGMPLTIAVRSGAAESMPGMMDTVLNLGLFHKSDEESSVLALARATNDRFAWDSYRRFIEMYGRTVLGIVEEDISNVNTKVVGFNYILEKYIHDKNKKLAKADHVKDEYGLGAEDFKVLCNLYKEEIARQYALRLEYEKTGKEELKKFREVAAGEVPDDPYEQYLAAVERVFESTFNDRAMSYRETEGFKLEDTMSAVNVLPMIYGNLSMQSGSGVSFSRNLSTGEKVFNLEYNVNCQGEDVVSGRKKGLNLQTMQKNFPAVSLVLEAIGEFLEGHYTNSQDMEFTFQEDPETGEITLWMLQTRNGKRTSQAEFIIAKNMVDEGLIDEKTAVDRITPSKIDELLAPQFEKEAKKKAIEEGQLLSANGLNASPGAAVGHIVFNSEDAVALAQKIKNIRERIKAKQQVDKKEIDFVQYTVKNETTGEEKTYDIDVILVRDETSPDDIDGMKKSAGFLTKLGGRTSHAALVARQLGVPAVVGDDSIKIDFKAKTVTFMLEDGTTIVKKEHEVISIDGTGEKKRGQVFNGAIKTVPSAIAQSIQITGLPKVNQAIILLESWITELEEKHLNTKQKDLMWQWKTERARLQEQIDSFKGTPRTTYDKKQVKLWSDRIKQLDAQVDGLFKYLVKQGTLPKDTFARINEYKKYKKKYEEHIAEYKGIKFTKEEQKLIDAYNAIQKWGNEFRKEKGGLGIRGNDEEPINVLTAKLNGAEGLGLVRTEHMFSGENKFSGEKRELKFQKMILAQNPEERKVALDELAALQQADFEQIFLMLGGSPATIRLVDPPLHEFLPHEKEKVEELATFTGLSVAEVENRIKSLKEENPMFGTRGVRLSVLMPEIIEMQVTAIFNAVKNLEKAAGVISHPEIMVPLVGKAEELKFVKDRIEAIAEKLGVKRDTFKIGTMVEIVAATVNIADIAEIAEFLSFGTNDLTQGVHKISRDDGKDWLDMMNQTKVFENDPFTSITPEVAAYIKRTIEGARAANPTIKIGICGEQGVDVDSIRKYLAPYGLSYVSGSSRRLPAAQIAAAQEAQKGHKPLEGKAMKPVAVDETATVNDFADRQLISVEKYILSENVLYKLAHQPVKDIDFSLPNEVVNEIATIIKGMILNDIKDGRGNIQVRLPDIALQNIFEKLENMEKLTKKYGEANRAIGTRGMRAVVKKEIQSIYRAVIKAAIDAAAEKGRGLDLVLPLVTTIEELKLIREGDTKKGMPSIDELVQHYAPEGMKIDIGTIIETPSLSIRAGELVDKADFVLFDSKKFTEAVWAAFEGDAKRDNGFLNRYMAEDVKIFTDDPFTFAPFAARQLMGEAIRDIRDAIAGKTILENLKNADVDKATIKEAKRLIDLGMIGMELSEKTSPVLSRAFAEGNKAAQIYFEDFVRVRLNDNDATLLGVLKALNVFSITTATDDQVVYEKPQIAGWFASAPPAEREEASLIRAPKDENWAVSYNKRLYRDQLAAIIKNAPVAQGDFSAVQQAYDSVAAKYTSLLKTGFEVLDTKEESFGICVYNTQIYIEKAFLDRIEKLGNPFHMLERAFVYALTSGTHEERRIAEYEFAKEVIPGLRKQLKDKRFDVEEMFEALVENNVDDKGSADDLKMRVEIRRRMRASLWEIGVHLMNGDMELKKVNWSDKEKNPFKMGDDTGDMRIGFCPIKANPPHFGHLDSILRMIAQHKLSETAMQIQGSDYRKKDVGATFESRLKMMNDIIQKLQGLLVYADIHHGTDKDGESCFEKFFEINKGRRGKLFGMYYAGGDHAHFYAPNTKVAKDKDGYFVPKMDGDVSQPDVMIKMENMQDRLSDLFASGKAEYAVSFSIRDIDEITPTQGEKEKLEEALKSGKMSYLCQLNLDGTSSTEIRNALAGKRDVPSFLPLSVYRHILGDDQYRGFVSEIPMVLVKLAASDIDQGDVDLLDKWITDSSVRGTVTPKTFMDYFGGFKITKDSPYNGVEITNEVVEKALATLAAVKDEAARTASVYKKSEEMVLVKDESILNWTMNGKSLGEILDKVVKEYDVRGFDGKGDATKYPQQIDLELLTWMGRALGTVNFTSDRHGQSVHLKPGDTFVMGGDNGPSTPEWREALANGLRDVGINVIDLGTCASGQLYSSIKRFGAQGGLYITRSHVEVGTNGFKPVIGGITLYGDMLFAIKDQIKSATYRKAARGTLDDSKETQAKARQMYVEALTKEFNDVTTLLQTAGLDIGVNLGGGSAASYGDLFRNILGSNIEVLREEDDPYCKKGGLPDPSRKDELEDEKLNVIALSEKNPQRLYFNFDLDADRVSIVWNGQLYLGDEMFYPIVEYMLTIDQYKDINKVMYYDSRMKTEMRDLIEYFGGIAKIHPKGHSKVKASMDMLFRNLAAQTKCASVADFLEKHPGFRMAQAEYSLHMFLSNDKSESFDDALRFTFFWLRAFLGVRNKHEQKGWDLGAYITYLKESGIVKESKQVKEQRTPMPEDMKKQVMLEMERNVIQFFGDSDQFEIVPNWQQFEGAKKPFTLIEVEGVFHLITPLGDAFWGWSNTSPKVAYGTQSASDADLKALTEIITALFVYSRETAATITKVKEVPSIDDKETAALRELFGVKATADQSAGEQIEKICTTKYPNALAALSHLAMLARVHVSTVNTTWEARAALRDNEVEKRMEALHGLTYEEALKKDPYMAQIMFDKFEGFGNRAGWTKKYYEEILTPGTIAAQELDKLKQVGEKIRDQFRYVIFCGMGGSGLSVKVVKDTFGEKETKIYSMRTTDPTVLKELLDEIAREEGSLEEALERTLIIPISKSGTTAETVSHKEYFERLNEMLELDIMKHMWVVTDEKQPGDKGYGIQHKTGDPEQVFTERLDIQLNKLGDIGGRFTAPATLIFLLPLVVTAPERVDEILSRAYDMNNVPFDEDVYMDLAAQLFTLAQQGKDKVTLIVPNGLKSIPIWAEQLVEESLGKDGKGITLFYGEDLTADNLRAADKDDRVFVRLNVGNTKGNPALWDYISRNGYPTFNISLDSLDDIGGLMFGLQRTVASIGYLWNICFVNQPNVTGYKGATNDVMAEAKKTGKPVGISEDWEGVRSEKGTISLYYEPLIDAGIFTLANLQDMVRSMGVEDFAHANAAVVYAAIIELIATDNVEAYEWMSYGRLPQELQTILGEERTRLITNFLQLPSKLGEGPDKNHSFHQNIEGGKDMWFSTYFTPLEFEQPIVNGKELPYDDQLIKAQTIGTVNSLVKAGRKVSLITVDTKNPDAVSDMADFFDKVIESIKTSREAWGKLREVAPVTAPSQEPIAEESREVLTQRVIEAVMLKDMSDPQVKIMAHLLFHLINQNPEDSALLVEKMGETALIQETLIDVQSIRPKAGLLMSFEYYTSFKNLPLGERRAILDVSRVNSYTSVIIGVPADSTVSINADEVSDVLGVDASKVVIRKMQLPELEQAQDYSFIDSSGLDFVNVVGRFTSDSLSYFDRVIAQISTTLVNDRVRVIGSDTSQNGFMKAFDLSYVISLIKTLYNEDGTLHKDAVDVLRFYYGENYRNIAQSLTSGRIDATAVMEQLRDKVREAMIMQVVKVFA